MQPRTQEVLEYIGDQRTTLELALTEVPEQHRHRRPAPDRWSVAEILEHLSLVEKSITKLIAAHLEKARASGLGQEQETDAVLSTMPLTQLLNRAAKLEASQRSLPSGTVSAADAWATLLERRRSLVTLLRDADGLALSQVVIPHAMLGPLNVYQWFVFVGAHEGRHAAQIRETGASLINTKN